VLAAIPANAIENAAGIEASLSISADDIWTAFFTERRSFDHLALLSVHSRSLRRVNSRSSGLTQFLGHRAGLFALENPADVDTGPAISIRLTWAVADQAANFSVLA
jgi:hypothetical protein